MLRCSFCFSGKFFNNSVTDVGVDDAAAAAVIPPGCGNDLCFAHGGYAFLL